jgi:hypothetical protein
MIPRNNISDLHIYARWPSYAGGYPIVWNEVTGNIVGGHQRYKVLVNEGATEVDCVVVHIENRDDDYGMGFSYGII